MNVKTIWSFIRETFREWSEDKAPRLAAALSYYTVFSLAPLLVLIIAITGFIIGNNQGVREQLLTQIQGLVGQQGSDIVNTMIDRTAQPRAGIIATVLGIVTLLLGATGVFGQLKESLNTIWDVEPKKSGGIWRMIKDRFLSFTMVLGISFLLLVSLVISTALSVINTYFTNLFGGMGFIAQIINFIISTGVITLIFAMIFRYLPDVEIKWRDVWIGALVTAILFNIGKSLIGLYLGSSAAASTYGAAGSLVILLLWVYYSAQILFMGAEFTQVYARRHGSLVMAGDNTGTATDTEHGRSGIDRQKKPVERIQEAMIPVAGQPALHSETGQPREVVRYEPPNPATVVPVIAGGAVASVYTLLRVAQKISHLTKRPRYPNQATLAGAAKPWRVRVRH